MGKNGKKTERANLRLTPATKEKLDYLKSEEGIKTADIFENAVDRLYDTMIEKARLEDDKTRRLEEAKKITEMLENGVDEFEIKAKIRSFYNTF